MQDFHLFDHDYGEKKLKFRLTGRTKPDAACSAHSLVAVVPGILKDNGHSLKQ